MRPESDEQSIRLFYLLKLLNKCHREHSLLEDGDRIALALSGGKDSCALLDALVQRRGIERYTIVALHVTPASDMHCNSFADADALAAWVDRLGVEYHTVPAQEVQGQPRRVQQSPCFYCTWRKRKALFAKAQALGCNKLALAHNADDVAQTTLLNLFYQGQMATMYPRVPLFGGKLVLIRPLAFVSEGEIERYAKNAGFPPPPLPCPTGQASRRALMRQVLKTIEETNPKVRLHLWRAISRCRTQTGERN